MTKQGTVQYYFTCKVELGNGTNLTVFADNSKEVSFLSGGASWSYVLRIRVNCTATFGTLLDANSKSTSSGCMFYFGDNVANIYNIYSDGTSYFYSSLFSTMVTATTYIQLVGPLTRIWGCVASGVNFRSPNSNVDFFNVRMQTKAWLRASGTYNTIRAVGSTYPFFTGETDPINMTNVYVRNCTYIACLQSITADSYLINCDSDTWSIWWTGSGWTGELYRQYEYDLTVLNGEITDFVEDANVTLSKGGVQIGTWLTNSSGQIDTQTLTYGYYNQTGGNTMYDGSNPFVLTVTHEDWADYTSRFYVTEKTKMTISMQDTTTANNAALIWSMLFGTLAFAVFFVWWVRR